MNFNETSRKIVTYDDIKSDQKRKLYLLFRQYTFLNILLGLRCFSNFSFHLNKKKLRENF